MGKNATKLNNNKSVVTNAKNDGGKAQNAGNSKEKPVVEVKKSRRIAETNQRRNANLKAQTQVISKRAGGAVGSKAQEKAKHEDAKN